MSDYGPEHLNVTMPGMGFNPLVPTTLEATLPTTARGWRDFVRQANKNAENLQAAINRVHHTGGGVVYIPAGRYHVGRNRVVTSGSPVPSVIPVYAEAIDSGFLHDVSEVCVYPDVTLSFAPGAVLVPMNFALAGSIAGVTTIVNVPERGDESGIVKIEIQGEIEAELRPIFDTTVALGPIGLDPLTAGLILFTGNKVREVYPEWWGAVLEDPAADVLNQRAFQAAIDAAHTNRRRPMREMDGSVSRTTTLGVKWWNLPSIPVVLKNRRFISKALRVGRVQATTRVDVTPELLAPNPATFMMVGEREVGNSGAGTFSLVAGSAWTSATDALLEIRGVSSVVLRDLHFNANHSAYTALHFEPGVGSGNVEVSNVVFHSTLHHPESALVRILSTVTSGRVNVAFTRCRLEPNTAVIRTVLISQPPPPPGQPAVQPDLFGEYAPGINGVEIDVDDEVNVEFRTCFMTSAADPMINARRGHFSLNECALQTNRVRHDPERSVHGAISVEIFNSSNGTDVFIQPPRSVNGSPDAPASFTAREVESQSYQFLATFPEAASGSARMGRSPTGSRSACVLLNAHHVSVPGEAAEAPSRAAGDLRPAYVLNVWDRRPSIYWAGPGASFSHLISIASRWSGLYLPADDVGGIRLGPNQRGDIYHLGNTTGQPPAMGAGYDSTSTEVRPDGFIASEPPAGLPFGQIHTLHIRAFMM